jgi:hypothetical protein
MAVEKKSEQDDNKALMLHKHSHIHSLGVRRRVFTNIEKILTCLLLSNYITLKSLKLYSTLKC